MFAVRGQLNSVGFNFILQHGNGSRGSNLTPGPGSLTEKGRMARIRDKRARPVRAFPVGLEGPVFFTRSCRFASMMEGGVKLTGGQIMVFTTEVSEKHVCFFQVMSLIGPQKGRFIINNASSKKRAPRPVTRFSRCHEPLAHTPPVVPLRALCANSIASVPHLHPKGVVLRDVIRHFFSKLKALMSMEVC